MIGQNLRLFSDIYIININLYHMRSEVLTVVNMKVAVFWIVAPGLL
jgi:hypothetical protein